MSRRVTVALLALSVVSALLMGACVSSMVTLLTGALVAVQQ